MTSRIEGEMEVENLENQAVDGVDGNIQAKANTKKPEALKEKEAFEMYREVMDESEEEASDEESSSEEEEIEEDDEEMAPTKFLVRFEKAEEDKKAESIDYSKMNMDELKKLIQERNLEVLDGDKQELVSRLEHWDYGIIDTRPGKGTVHQWLKEAGVDRPEDVSSCLKAGIRNGFYEIKGPESLETVIFSDKCMKYTCKEEIVVKIKDILYQPDIGTDYGLGGPAAKIKCPKAEQNGCWGMYVAELCQGNPEFHDGKFFNHCKECTGFGECICETREKHCPDCNEHYWWPGGEGCYICQEEAMDLEDEGEKEQGEAN